MSPDSRGTTLRQRSSKAVNNERLQDVLSRFTSLLTALRTGASYTLGNYEELREAARSIRAHVVANLPEVLDRLAGEVEARGGRIWWASTAGEATEYVCDVARRTGARVAVKSKSMVSEEIGLNSALQAAGVEVVETDLGEWIIQLAGETPSHIVGPAIHKTTEEVASLFSRVAGRTLPDVPAELAAFARAHLREKFLTAGIGISGVNFAIAETGSVVIVTNEGNGRMVTSLPRVHVAIMGMERALETWQQLDVLLALLTRCATGQEVTAYVSAITGPRRPGEIDGPDEFHLVILDNGRSEILGTEFQEILHCIRCGACLNACPVYRQIGGHAYGSVYSGPVGAVLTPILRVADPAPDLAYACSLCGACHQACPVKIRLPDLLVAARRKDAEHAGTIERLAWSAWAQAWRRPAIYRASCRATSVAGRWVPESLIPKRWTAGRSLPRPTPSGGVRAPGWQGGS